MFAIACAAALSACNEPSVMEEVDRQEQEQAAGAETRLQEGANFMRENAKKPGVVTTESGLQFTVVRKGNASLPSPGPNDVVAVQYEGRLVDGAIFDSSYKRGQPMTIGVGEVIPGWTEALQLMKPGEEYRLVIPPQLGYGPTAQGEIPPNSVLIFKVELLGFQRRDGSVVRPDGIAAPRQAQAAPAQPKPAAQPPRPKSAAPPKPQGDGQIIWE
jgi:FKBP-type peptidyl-prolyl cis-trans isomerase FklB